MRRRIKAALRRLLALLALIVRSACRFAWPRILGAYHSKPGVYVRRRMEQFDQAFYDAARLYAGTWLTQDKGWPPPKPRPFLRVPAVRRALLERLREVASKMSVPISVVGAAHLGKNVLGRYRVGASLPQIEILDVRQDDPWILAHELGHHFAITFKGDKREAAADAEARRLVESAAGKDAAWLRPLTVTRLPADGRMRLQLAGGLSVVLALLAVGVLLGLLRAKGASHTVLSVDFFYLWLFLVFGLGRLERQLDPPAREHHSAAYVVGFARPSGPPSKHEARLEKLRRLRDDEGATAGERRNASAEIERMRKARR